MSISFNIEDDIGVFTSVGDVEFEEGLRILEQGLLQLKQSGLTPVLLFNITESTEERSSEELQLMAAYIHERLPGSHLAMVVSNDLYFGISRMFTSFAESFGMEAAVFREVDEAYAWCIARTRVNH